MCVRARARSIWDRRQKFAHSHPQWRQRDQPAAESFASSPLVFPTGSSDSSPLSLRGPVFTPPPQLWMPSRGTPRPRAASTATRFLPLLSSSSRDARRLRAARARQAPAPAAAAARWRTCRLGRRRQVVVLATRGGAPWRRRAGVVIQFPDRARFPEFSHKGLVPAVVGRSSARRHRRD